jgi:hypothetical protein
MELSGAYLLDSNCLWDHQRSHFSYGAVEILPSHGPHFAWLVHSMLALIRMFNGGSLSIVH